jgi:hypothetical protein
MLLFQQFESVTEADAFGPHYPVDHAPAFSTRPQTVPEIFSGLISREGEWSSWTGHSPTRSAP